MQAMALLRQPGLRLTQSLGALTRVPAAHYHEKVIDHYENPRWHREPSGYASATGLSGMSARWTRSRAGWGRGWWARPPAGTS
jgi:hypothetical protein